jgi:hypothetical protein
MPMRMGIRSRVEILLGLSRFRFRGFQGGVANRSQIMHRRKQL